MKRLINVQQSLRIAKDKEGDKGKFRYRTAEDILEKAKPFLKENGLAVTLADKIVEVGGRVFLQATATLWGTDGVCMETTGMAELDPHTHKVWNRDSQQYDVKQSMSLEQATGSASSYARKYALCGMFAIDDSKDDPDALVETPTLASRIAAAKNADDINALIAEMSAASDDEKKAFNAMTKNLKLTYNKEAKKYEAEVR